MSKILKCPDCGKLIATIFPLHNCIPLKKEKKVSKRYWHQKSTREQKINWLLDHQDLWIGWNDIEDPRHREIFDLMVKEGLVSEKSYWKDLSLTKLIYEARKIRREGGSSMGYVGDLQMDNSPTPLAHKSLHNYQSQLKAKKKRRKR